MFDAGYRGLDEESNVDRSGSRIVGILFKEAQERGNDDTAFHDTVDCLLSILCSDRIA
jgi:hypothetical protein